MFEIVKQQGETLDEHGNRIKRLEDSDKEKADAIEVLSGKYAEISSNFTRMENTILKSAQSTQDLMSTQSAQQWKLIEALSIGQEEDKKRKHELKKNKMEKFWELAGKVTMAVLGSGGLIIVWLEFLSK